MHSIYHNTETIVQIHLPFTITFVLSGDCIYICRLGNVSKQGVETTTSDTGTGLSSKEHGIIFPGLEALCSSSRSQVVTVAGLNGGKVPLVLHAICKLTKFCGVTERQR